MRGTWGALGQGAGCSKHLSGFTPGTSVGTWGLKLPFPTITTPGLGGLGEWGMQ